MSGYFITFEGGEGVGKTTQISLLAQYLRNQGYDVLTTREPGGTVGAEAIRHILLSGQAQNYGPLIEVILLTAARIDHITEVIAPSLQKGKIVLCDRFIDSTRVYQGLNNTVGSSVLSVLEYVALNGIMPCLTFLLDIPARCGMERANLRRKKAETIDYFEKDELKIQEQRRQAFLQLAKQEPHRFRVIDATGAMEVIAQQIKNICHQVILDQVP
ncbi:dTMP kinase [Bartonella quintana]|uniref:Thymidylate kinase n=3 Tax=Bartonella quintana TaxID=803 RepID=KTHY_BARQU|nr:dTMP kinase [Bartonella quintana]Q6FZU8.1 RecName: Full=Thymidylate kinase; AltName: Full=dTMP kinase [Bartonella quintana str. Toulouse]ETS11482.1 thymidylate kinase [Bartonella quintana BQ2-D70]ETS14310.1 thymidylate kinase [Bartonella quintana JK 73rel]ETS15997.1 thymidylate kinase [Bartonella quintana JK 73]ETS18000.1 thymidylate kinase [Bartonella quintana JK 7]ETS18829.1 thymidylate kinase [Bartonella quintana JK 12]